MSISQINKFNFDAYGFLHLRNILKKNEIKETLKFAKFAEGQDIQNIQNDQKKQKRYLLNRPISRIIDVDPRFLRFLDHKAVSPYLECFLGKKYRHIDNELYYTYPGYKGGHWHRGISSSVDGYVKNGTFYCKMVKVFFCLTNVRSGGGEFAVVPGSHKSNFKPKKRDIEKGLIYSFNNINFGDIIIFNEALLHKGLPNISKKTRKTVIVNFGRKEAGVWPGYIPRKETLDKVTYTQKEILSNTVNGLWINMKK